MKKFELQIMKQFSIPVELVLLYFVNFYSGVGSSHGEGLVDNIELDEVFNGVNIERRVEPVTVATAILVAAAIDAGTNVLKSLNDYYFEDEAKVSHTSNRYKRT